MVMKSGYLELSAIASYTNFQNNSNLIFNAFQDSIWKTEMFGIKEKRGMK